MAAAIVLLSGMVSKTGRSWLISVLAVGPHFATDGVALAQDSGRNPTATIPEAPPARRVRVGAIPSLQVRNVLIVRDFVLLQGRL
jgi:hypothetical protein